MQQYLVGDKVMDFDKLIFISTDGNDANNGKIDAPVKTVYHALELATSDNDGIVFLPGEYNLEAVYHINSEVSNSLPYQSGAFSCPSWVKNIDSKVSKMAFIGQGKNATFNYDARQGKGKSHTRCLIFGNKLDLYRMNVKIIPDGTGAWENALINGTRDSNLYNCAVENVGTTKMSMINLSEGWASSLHYCVVKNNARQMADNVDANNNFRQIKNTQFDWNYTNATTMENKLVRTITDDDLLTGSASDLNASDGSKIGVYGSEYTWGPSSTGYLVSMRYQDENGNELQPDEIKVVMLSEDFTASAKAISGYTLKGYRLDGNQLQVGGNVILSAVDADHIITFVYVRDDGSGGEEGSSDKCCCTKVDIKITTCSKNKDLLSDINDALIRDGEKRSCQCSNCK